MRRLMAIIYEQRRGGRLYQVRTAGSSVRLYTNGVFHSQYSPSRRAVTSLWDLLVMPALLVPRTQLRRVLVLGVGGGAVLRRISDLFGEPHIVGVELDPVHLTLARRYFGLDRVNVELVTANAGDWLKSYKGAPFDLIVDDLFGDIEGDAQRAVKFDTAWLELLCNHLTDHGVIAVNFADLGEFLASPVRGAIENHRQWSGGYSMRLEALENVVAILGRIPFSLPEFVGAIEATFSRATANRCNIRAIRGGRKRRGKRR
jgi:spermidine synthase